MFLDVNVGQLTELLTGRTVNRREIAFRVAERVGQYQDEGLARGDRVLVCYGNNLEFFIDLLAVWHLGAGLVPIDGRLTAVEVKNLARAVRPRFILVDPKADNSIIAAMTAAGAKMINPAAWNVSNQTQSVAMPYSSRARLDDEALILFTSGSTGTPKGVVHTHRSLRARWIALRESLGVQSYHRTLCLLPTHFGHGLICKCLFPWLSGLDLYIAPASSTDFLMQLGRLIEHGTDREVLKAIRKGYPVGRILVISTLGSGVGMWITGGTEFFASAMDLAKLSEYWDRALNFVCLLVLGFGTRGTLDHRPLNPSFASINRNRIANEIASCGMFNLLYE